MGSMSDERVSASIDEGSVKYCERWWDLQMVKGVVCFIVRGTSRILKIAEIYKMVKGIVCTRD